VLGVGTDADACGAPVRFLTPVGVPDARAAAATGFLKVPQPGAAPPAQDHTLPRGRAGRAAAAPSACGARGLPRTRPPPAYSSPLSGILFSLLLFFPVSSL